MIRLLQVKVFTAEGEIKVHFSCCVMSLAVGGKGLALNAPALWAQPGRQVGGKRGSQGLSHLLGFYNKVRVDTGYSKTDTHSRFLAHGKCS